MKIKTALSVLLLILSFSGFAQKFELIKPDTIQLKQLYDLNNYAETMAYLYIQSNYDSISAKDSATFFEGAPNLICGFKQSFHLDIEYSISLCSDEEPSKQKISFPRMELKKVQEFIESLFYDPWNTWESEYRYSPDGVGCSYTIIQTEKRTIIQIYCGC